MINKYISELINYGLKKGLVPGADKIYTTNRVLEVLELSAYEEMEVTEERDLHRILDDISDYAYEKGLFDENTIAQRDLFDTKIMGCMTPMPSVVIEKFQNLYERSPKEATDYYYDFSKSTNYIRVDRIAKDKKWTVDTEYGVMDITINLSKPEKDPKDIAKAANAKKSGYPSCLLCKENEGYGGNISHPARQNHRIIPIKLGDDRYFMQYSPYVYYNEHCIILNEKHIPMKIDKAVFEKLTDFVSAFPEYMIGSNADLPIVGGSILSHDHFQGGRYEFPMAKAAYEYEFPMERFPTVRAGAVKWPMSVIRLQAKEKEDLVNAADYILNQWRMYDDEDAFIFHHTDGKPHNTITPIARRRDDKYEMDLVLRNNITTEDKPWGVYHPTENLHHIKKENIGLIEVMGLAILPSRLKTEMEILKDAVLKGKNIRDIQEIEKHADWVEEWQQKYTITEENIDEVIEREIGNVFVQVLECAGVYKRDQKGTVAFKKFINILSKGDQL